MLPVILGFSSLPTAAAQASDAKAPLLHGQMSNAVLARVTRLRPAEVAECCRGAAEALTFYFFAEPVGDTLRPTITETVDFSIDGKSYGAMSLEQLGAKVEPQTVIYDPEDVLGPCPELRGVLPAGFKAHSAFKITIGGMQLPDRGIGEVVLKFGFHGDVEPFAFPFSIPSKPDV
jgi:hypothetical protein